jgi:uncharacterized protein (DUF885 family)
LKASTLAYLRVLFSFATAYQNKNNYEDALRLFDECYKVSGVSNHQGFLMRVSFNQGFIHDLHLNNKAEAEKYYELTRDIATTIGDQAMRGRAIASIGFVKKQKFLVDSGIQLIRQSGDTTDLEEYIQERDEIWPS